MTKSEHKHQSLLHGAFILVASILITKLIGAIFKIPLMNLIGGEGMGYFSTAYDLFNPIYALSVAGLPIAVAKIVAENMALGKYNDVKKTMRITTLTFFITGVIGTLIILFGARIYVNILPNPKAYWAVVMIAPAVFFGCMMSAYRGYYEGLRNMIPTALSQVIEAIVKLVIGYSVSYLVLSYGLNQYKETGMVLGTAVKTLEQAKSVILPYSAAGAVLGITLSTLAGTLYLWISHKVKGDGISKDAYKTAPVALTGKSILKKLLLIAIPVSLGSLAVNITSIIDLFTVMGRLHTAINADADTVLSMFSGLLPDGIKLDDIPNYLYGTYKGIVMTLFNLVPSITVAFGIAALPAVASTWAQKDMLGTKKNIEAVLRITTLIAIPAGLGLSALSGPIVNLLYGAKPMEAQIAAPMLTVMGIAVIFVSVLTPVNSMLQAVGRADIPPKLILFGGIIKLSINFTLVGIPKINIHGAPIGSVFCYLFIIVMSIVILCRTTKIIPNIISVFIKPIIASIFCIGTAVLVNIFLSNHISTKISLLTSIALGGIVYFVALLVLRAITKDDILMMPKGEKLAKFLEDKRLIDK